MDQKACDERHAVLDERLKGDEVRLDKKLSAGWFWKVIGGLIVATMIALGFSITYAMDAQVKIQAAEVLAAKTATTVDRQAQDLQEIKEILREIERTLRNK